MDETFKPGDPAIGYYRQLVTGLAPRLRAVADALPSYTVERDAEFLAKLDELGRTVPEILAGVREIGERQRAEEARRRWETETHEELYLRSLQEHVQRVTLFGVDLDRDTPSSLPLSIAYIPLRLRLGPNEEARGQPLGYSELLALLPLLGNRLLIEGAAGSGKTTVLQWTALEALLVRAGEKPAPPGLPAVVDRHPDVVEAIGQPQHGLLDELLRSAPRLARGQSARMPGLQEAAAEFLGEGGLSAGKSRLGAEPWHARTPFFVRLRLCPEGRLPEPDGLPALIAHGSGSAPEPWVKRRLLDGRALVLLDGIDEVPDAKRRDIRESIANYFRHYRDAQFVVTSRPAAVKDPAWGELFGSCRAAVQGMVPVDIESFVEQWYEALAETGRSVFDRAAVDRITGEILASAALRQLAETPLLCAAICYLHRVRRGELPRRLNGLYEKLCELLIHRRDREQFEQEGQERLNLALRGLDLDDRQALLARLAHYMVREEVAALDLGRAEEQVRAGLAGLRKLDGRKPSDVLDALQERSGVLRGASPTAVEFAHNGLRSYLAASVFRGEASYGDVVSKALATDDPDLPVLAAAQGGEPYRDSLVGELLTRAGRAETNRGPRRVLLIMAARCGNTGPVPAATAERLAAVERSVLPPRTLPEAGQLAELRKRAIPALRRKRSQSPSVAAACVRCLRLIGGPEADALLEAYLDHEEDEVVDELAQAVNPLRVGKVAEAVLNSDMYRRPFEPVRHVREDDLAVLDGTTAHLTLAGARLRTAEPLRRFSALETLWLDGTPVADLAPLAGLAGLRELSLDGALVERDDPALEKLRQRGVSISI